VKKTIYISGPITGMPQGNRAAFADAARQLEAAGYQPVNPHGLGAALRERMAPVEPAWSDYMRPCIAAVMGCDGIALLPGWHKSRGATKESMAASWVYIPSKPLAEWLSNGVES
jgi:hypothetical protein